MNLYDLSAPAFISMLRNLSAILKKAEANAAERNIDPSVFLNSRLAPDMHPLTRQVQIACDQAKGSMARLAGQEPPPHPDTETTFAELQARIAKVIAFVETFKPEQLAGAEDRKIVLKFGPQEFPFTGLEFLRGMALTNFYFHVTMAYAILRHNGVPLGKRDFLTS